MLIAIATINNLVKCSPRVPFYVRKHIYALTFRKVGVISAGSTTSVRWIRTPNNPGRDMSGHKYCIDPKNFRAMGQAPWDKIRFSRGFFACL